jgi:hypothetical protein
MTYRKNVESREDAKEFRRLSKELHAMQLENKMLKRQLLDKDRMMAEQHATHELLGRLEASNAELKANQEKILEKLDQLLARK